MVTVLSGQTAKYGTAKLASSQQIEEERQQETQ